MLESLKRSQTTSVPSSRAGPIDLSHKLGPRGAEEEQLGEWIELEARVLEDLADPLAGLGAARLAHQQHLIAERAREQLRLRGLPGAVDSLERDEHLRSG